MGRAIHRHSLEFKRKAVKLSPLDGVEVQACPTLWISIPSCCRGGAKKCAATEGELRLLQALERGYALLHREPELITRGGIPDGNAPWNRSFIFSKPILCRVSGS